MCLSECLKLKCLHISRAVEDVQQLELANTAGGNDNGIATLINILALSREVNIHLPYYTAITLPSIHPREKNVSIHTKMSP